jgi:hypothetical protein
MKINHISKAVLAIAIGFAFVACEKGFEYTPAQPEDASKTVVSADLTAPRSLDVDGSDLSLPFVRNNTSGDLEVGVVLTDPSGIFSLKNSSIKFANGEKTAYAQVAYSYDALVPDTVYDIAVSIVGDEYASNYRPIAFPVACTKAWQKLGIAQFYDDWWIGGPFEKELIKSPDGSETYRLINPWDQKSVVDGGLDFVSELPYLEFKVAEDGSITWGDVINLGFTFSGMTCHNLSPAKRNDAASMAQNKMVLPNVAQFCWYPILNYTGSSFSWWGVTSVAYISFPGGPDLKTLLGL